MFELHEHRLILIDCQSTNGTYVNGQRITQPTVIQDSDLIQFADVAFRMRKDEQSVSSHTVAEDVCDQALSLVQFDRLMENRLVTPFFQPIVNIQTTELVGYEVLARSRLFGLESAGAMFDAATRLSMEVELSEMLRWEGIREGLTLPTPVCLYVNTHPRELESTNLLESVSRLRMLSNDLPLVLEIHESAVTEPKRMRELARQLRALNIKVAYDDFGAGQNRLAELAESPPDILKFDMSLIRNIHNAPPERQRMVASFVRISLDLGVESLAEGVETAGEATTCAQMGFVTAQGYYYGRPAPPRNYQGH
jgi:EAL domain-containing protein (putative c-di-GMP-specific phosphodiesterase class I)